MPTSVYDQCILKQTQVIYSLIRYAFGTAVMDIDLLFNVMVLWVNRSSAVVNDMVHTLWVNRSSAVVNDMVSTLWVNRNSAVVNDMVSTLWVNRSSAVVNDMVIVLSMLQFYFSGVQNQWQLCCIQCYSSTLT